MIAWDSRDTTWRDDPQSAADRAYDRGYDPSSAVSDMYPGPPLDDVWAEAFDRSLAEVESLREMWAR